MLSPSCEHLRSEGCRIEAERASAHCIRCEGEIPLKDFAIPVPQNLQGEDHVGMLFWDGGEELYWMKNTTRNQATWLRYGVNAVCWQTATGAWIAYRLLDCVQPDHPHTMTELSMLMPQHIEALLTKIGLTFHREDLPFDLSEFKRNIISYF